MLVGTDLANSLKRRVVKKRTHTHKLLCTIRVHSNAQPAGQRPLGSAPRTAVIRAIGIFGVGVGLFSHIGYIAFCRSIEGVAPLHILFFTGHFCVISFATL